MIPGDLLICLFAGGEEKGGSEKEKTLSKKTKKGEKEEVVL